MAHSETNTTSYPNAFVSGALLSLEGLGFAHTVTLAAIGCVSPLRASPPLSSRRRLRAPLVRGQVCLPDGFPPAPQPHLVSHPPLHPHRPPHAAERSAVPTFMCRFALARQGCRKSERTPNHALQRTGVAVTARASGPPPSPPAMHGPRQPRPSLSLGSLGVATFLPSKKDNCSPPNKSNKEQDHECHN